MIRGGFFYLNTVHIQGPFPQQLPLWEAPDGQEFVLKAWPTNIGIIYISPDPQVSNSMAYPLCPNDELPLLTKRTDNLYIVGIPHPPVLDDLLAIYLFEPTGGKR
jgi:hypothetical protein